MNLILKTATSFLVGWFRLASLGAVAIAYAWYWLIPQINKRKTFLTPDEHRRESETLQRERPDDPEAQHSATVHEQIAKMMEVVKFRRCCFSRWQCSLFTRSWWGFI